MKKVQARRRKRCITYSSHSIKKKKTGIYLDSTKYVSYDSQFSNREGLDKILVHFYIFLRMNVCYRVCYIDAQLPHYVEPLPWEHAGTPSLAPQTPRKELVLCEGEELPDITCHLTSPANV